MGLFCVESVFRNSIQTQPITYLISNMLGIKSAIQKEEFFGREICSIQNSVLNY